MAVRWVVGAELNTTRGFSLGQSPGLSPSINRGFEELSGPRAAELSPGHPGSYCTVWKKSFLVFFYRT
jgi:hypothetical protein